MKILFRAYNFIIQIITRSLIIFKKPRKMTNDFFNHYIFIRPHIPVDIIRVFN